MLERHALLENFLGIIGVEEARIYEDVEGIEHHLSWNSINRIGDVVQFFEENPDALAKLQGMQHVSRYPED